MKRILAIALTLIMSLSALTGCAASTASVKNPDEDLHIGDGDEEYKKIQFFPQPILEFTEEKNHDVTKFKWSILTDEDMELLRQVYNDGKGWTDDNLVDRWSFFFDGRIRFATADGAGWMYFGFVRNVLYYNGRFTTANTKVMEMLERVRKADGNNSLQYNEFLVSHIQIKSGADTIHPFGCMTWSRTENEDGTFDETFVDKYGVVDLVSGNSTFPASDIPTLVLNESVSYLIQANGKVEKVYLIAQSGDEYTKTETSFDALSDLPDGTYYVALEVLLSGNCDPDALQNSYRYEDVFRLVVGGNGKPAESDMITYSAGDTLSKFVLDNSEKQIVLDILGSDREWIPEIPECDWSCRFGGYVNVGYCDCGTLTDFTNNRSRKLTDEERKSLESLITNINRIIESPNEVAIELLQYTWDGWGISTKTVEVCDTAYSIIDALKSMKETGETVPKISDDVLEIGGGQYPIERGTMWIESSGKIYRLTPDLSQICLVETHFGEGKVLEMTDEFKTDVNNAWNYAPYDYYKGTYNKGDSTVDLTSVFGSCSSIRMRVKDIHVENNYDPHNTITVELTSTVDQDVTLALRCQQSDDNLAKGDCKILQLKKGVPVTVELTFGGFKNYTYWVYLEADYTKAEITINP